MKRYLTSLFILSKLEATEDFYIYLAVSEVAVISALIQEKLVAQLSVFYISKAILNAETRYPKIEKLILASVVVAQKLRPYFQAHTVIIMTQYPLWSILHGPDTSQRVMKWALELGQYGLVFQPHMAIKAQALANFIVKFTLSLEDVTSRPNDAPEVVEHTFATTALLDGDFWHLHVDNASNYKSSRAEVVLIALDGSMLKQAITLRFKVSNNKAEYEAILAGLRMAKDLAVKKLATHSNS